LNTPRFMLCATGSGSGKTTITCGILQALINRGLKTAAFKCGPDYIDPMFHSTVIGTKSRNIDTFFSDRNTARLLLAQNAASADIAVIEGVMGYYDGIANTSTASSFDVASTTDTPAVLIVNCAGMSLSVAALVKGFYNFKVPSWIQGVILNRISPSMYQQIKECIESTCPVKVYGYLPKVPDLTIESRHLGLVRPEEIPGLKAKLYALARQLEESLDIDGLLDLAKTAPPLQPTPINISKCGQNLKIAVARDMAFCFYYEDNLQLLRDMGAEIIEFSPMSDYAVPSDADGLLLGGGYPELYGEILSKNTSMLDSVYCAIAGGMPTIAECGGFMYLHKTLTDIDGVSYKMAGVLNGHAYYTGRLGRFGYIELIGKTGSLIGPTGTQIKGHEFHYFDSTCTGSAFQAVKPVRGTVWSCIHAKENLLCGFPHLYFYSNPKCAEIFLMKCRVYHNKRCRQ
jgi:cobyrinic acid a,c-diamide synthase